MKEEKGVLWIGMLGGGLCKVEVRNKKFILYQTGSGSASLSNNVVLSIVESRLQPGILWFGTMYRGINRFNPGEDTFIQYKDIPKNPAAGDSIVVTAPSLWQSGMPPATV